MGGFSLWHWLVVIAVVAVIFGGKGKLSGVMGDFAKGIKAFKSGMNEDEAASSPLLTPPPMTAPAVVASTIAAGERSSHERG